MSVAPNPMFPEKGVNVYERTLAPSYPGNKGPLRFEEGVATDTDVPMDFGIGAYRDTAGRRDGRNGTDPEMFFKHPEDTMRERAHVGSATWIDAPSVLSEFVQGSMAGDGMPQFEYEYNTGGYTKRPAPSVVYD